MPISRVAVGLTMPQLIRVKQVPENVSALGQTREEDRELQLQLQRARAELQLLGGNGA